MNGYAYFYLYSDSHLGIIIGIFISHKVVKKFTSFIYGS